MLRFAFQVGNSLRIHIHRDGAGIELEFNERIAPAMGISYGGRIALLPGQSKAEEFSTLVHELAHEMLHKAERRTTTTKVVRETEAEAIAFIVGKAVGSKLEALPLTTSSFITAVHRSWPRVLRSSNKLLLSSSPH